MLSVLRASKWIRIIQKTNGQRMETEQEDAYPHSYEVKADDNYYKIGLFMHQIGSN